ncbi:MAG: outer membrane lipoprotein carrier protein LolA [Leptospira sp.]|nr:outer membrane lipoprotein carrier protein LolA [Leptospira sp.]
MNSFETFRANILINGSLSGTLSYKKPGNIHVKFSDGREISANGRYLYFYSPERGVTGKQDLKGSSSGINGLLSGYQETTIGKTIKLKSNSKRYSEITISVDARNLPKSIRMVSSGSDNATEISFSNVSTGLGLSASLFNYQPPTSSIIVENPLNQKE